MKDFLQRLNLDIKSNYFEKAYNEAIKDEGIPYWLNGKYIENAIMVTGVGVKYLQKILSALDGVLQNEDLILFAKVMYYMIKNDGHYGNTLEGLKMPVSPMGEDASYDLVCVFPVLAHVENGYKSLLQRGLLKEDVDNTYGYLTDCILQPTGNDKERIVFSNIEWSTLYAKGRILRIGRFNFEICPSVDCNAVGFISKSGEKTVLMKDASLDKSGAIFDSVDALKETGFVDAEIVETENYYEGYAVNQDSALAEMKWVCLSKKEWKPVFSHNDSVVSIHVPENEPLDENYCERSYDMARMILPKAFPEYNFSAFVCFSWLLSRDLKMFLKPESNIMRFADKFTYFPIASTGLGAMVNVFGSSAEKVSDIDFDALPVTNNFTKNIKEYYKQGDIVHEVGGFFEF